MSSMVYSGCWCLVPCDTGHRKEYLPYADIKIHTSVLGTASRTRVTQTYYNGKSTTITNLNYTFPVFDGACIVSFNCYMDGKVIKGVLKERGAARAAYDEARNRGESAALLEQHELASDTFTTSIGNLQAGSKIVIELQYLLELQNDMQEDGIRITIPNQIAPRYADDVVLQEGFCTNQHSLIDKSSTEVTIDISMDQNSVIQYIQSKGTHPISITLGRISTSAIEEHQPNLASAYLKLEGDSALGDDIVLVIKVKDQGNPTAFLEHHSSIPGQRAVMATFVPRFNMAPAQPEIVFAIDRSGSMRHNIQTLRKALKVFLKSLPLGIKFNICGFGSQFSFLWDESRTYDEATLREAEMYVSTIRSDMGGTQILRPLQAIVEKRLKDQCLDVLLLTDGEVWDQPSLFSFINSTTSSQPSVRFFSHGIGATVSHSLIQGVARAGRGFAQTVTLKEDLDIKVMRMLKGALTEHINDLHAEIEFDAQPLGGTGDDDDFVIVDNSICFEQETSDRIGNQHEATPHHDSHSIEGVAIYDAPSSELPHLQRPPVLQVPYNIPGMFPFTRITMYMLLSPESTGRNPIGINIKGTSPSHELHIPISTTVHGTTINQLAARRLILDLEESRGWMFNAGADSHEQVAELHPSKLSDLVKKESVEMGMTFGVASKFCSFVAVQDLSDERTSNQSQCDPKEGVAEKDYGILGMESLHIEYQISQGSQGSASSTTPNPRLLGACLTARAIPKKKKVHCTNPHLTNDADAGLESSIDYSPRGRTHALIEIQSFNGSWRWDSEIFDLIGQEKSRMQSIFDQNQLGAYFNSEAQNCFATLLVISYLEAQCADEKEVWELIAEKARRWLRHKVDDSDRERSIQEQLDFVIANLQA